MTAFGIALFCLAAAVAQAQSFIHPGLLHRQSDLDRMRSMVKAGAEPWTSGWKRLSANSHSSLGYVARPASRIYRGTGTPENYARLFNDAAAGYALALRWHISGDAAYADAAVRLLDAWSDSLASIEGTSDRYLASGIYGYEMANAAELMRGYAGWAPADFARFRTMMMTVFYPMNHAFLTAHNGACISHYWANWDLCNMASMISIGVLCDNRSVYAEAVAYFKGGSGNGAIKNCVWFLHPGNLGQWQESGRDQGHSVMGPAVMGAVCETAWNQGDDLYGFDDNRFLKGAEYVAKYNLGQDVPYAAYDNCDQVDQAAISTLGRGEVRPGWELLYNHYVNRMGLDAPYCRAQAEARRPEGGGGDYGPNSGGFDQLGYGTLTATLAPGSVGILASPRDIDSRYPDHGRPGLRDAPVLRVCLGRITLDQTYLTDIRGRSPDHLFQGIKSLISPK